LKKPCVLVVDDSPTMREMISIVLNSNGYEAIATGGAAEGLLALETQPVDVVISDVNMPVTGGLQFLAKIRETERFANIPVIFLTTERSTEVRQRGRQSGAAAWMTKPFDPPTLLEFVRSVLPP
jgi:two-component system, chemotaxis family, chemotaxis protein CheY